MRKGNNFFSIKQIIAQKKRNILMFRFFVTPAGFKPATF